MGGTKMKLMFEFDIDKKKIVFVGNGFKVSSPAETYEDIAEFAKDVIENYIGIPKLKHREIEKKADDNLQLFYLLLNCINNSNSKNYYVKKTGELYKGQIFLNCGKITDSFGNEIIFI